MAACSEATKDDNDGDERDGRHGEGRARRPVVRAPEALLNDVGEHDAGRAAHLRGCHVVARRRHEDDDGGGNYARKRKREGNAAETPPRPVAQIRRRFEQRPVDLLKRHIDRQHRERRVGVRERDDDGGRVVEQEFERLVDHPDRNEAGIDDAVIAEHDFPGENAQEIARPERDRQ